MPRWLRIIVRSGGAGIATSAWVALIDLTGGPTILISLGVVLIVLAVSGNLSQD